MSKKLIAISLASLLITTSISSYAYADKNDILKVLGGVAAGLAVGAMQNNDANQSNSNVRTTGRTLPSEDVQWNDTNAPKAVRNTPRPNHDVQVIQKILNKTGYYSGKTDGFTSDSTLKALNRFEDDYGLSKTTSISSQTEERMYEIYKNFSCPEDYKLAVKTSSKDKGQVINGYRISTNNHIQDFQEYIKNDNVTIDTSEASKHIIAAKNAQRDPRACLVKENDNLIRYTSNVNGFNAYAEKKNQERLQQELQILSNLKVEADQYKEFADHYLKNNLGNEKAIALQEQINKEPDIVKASLPVYSKYIRDVKSLVDNDYNIRSEYTSWNNTRLQNQAIKTESKSLWSRLKKYYNNKEVKNTDPLSTSRYKFEVKRSFETVIVGGDFDEVKANDDNVFIVVDYKYQNISGKSLSAFKKPNIYLKDDKGQKYKSDKHAVSSYLTHMDVEDKWFSDINPNMIVESAGVFEINRNASKSNWTIVLVSDETIEVPLILSGDDGFKMSERYKKLTPNQRKQLERVEKDPSKFWEAFIEIDEEARQQESINNLMRNYR